MTAQAAPRVTVEISGGIMGIRRHYEVGGGHVVMIAAIGGPPEVSRRASFGELTEITSAASQATKFSQADIVDGGVIYDGFNYRVSVDSPTSGFWSVTYSQGDTVPQEIKSLAAKVLEIAKNQIEGPEAAL